MQRVRQHTRTTSRPGRILEVERDQGSVSLASERCDRVLSGRCLTIDLLKKLLRPLSKLRIGCLKPKMVNDGLTDLINLRGVFKICDYLEIYNVIVKSNRHGLHWIFPYFLDQDEHFAPDIRP